MNNQISLKEVERKVFISFFQDGLVDIFLGFFFTQFVIAPYLSESLGDFWSSAVFVPIWGLLFILLWLVRKYVVKPRVGEVKFGKWRKNRLMRFNVIILIVLLASAILAALSAAVFDLLPAWVNLAPLSFSIVLLVSFSLAGFFLNYPLFYVYGVILAAAPIVGEWLWANTNVTHHGFPVTFGFASGVMILVGLLRLTRLLLDHPLPPSTERTLE
jgi:hypothetical protein